MKVDFFLSSLDSLTPKTYYTYVIFSKTSHGMAKFQRVVPTLLGVQRWIFILGVRGLNLFSIYIFHATRVSFDTLNSIKSIITSSRIHDTILFRDSNAINY